MDAVTPLGEWTAEAACRDTPKRIFFPEAGDPETAHWVAYFCAQCPVERECLEFALVSRERFGIWGGKTETQRRDILRRRDGARPAMARAPRPRRQAG